MWGKCVPGGARSKCKGPEAESSVASWRNWGRARVRGSPDRLEGLLGPTTAGLRGLGSRCHLLQLPRLPATLKLKSPNPNCFSSF